LAANYGYGAGAHNQIKRWHFVMSGWIVSLANTGLAIAFSITKAQSQCLNNNLAGAELGFRSIPNDAD